MDGIDSVAETRRFWRRERAQNKRFNTGPASLSEAPGVGLEHTILLVLRLHVPTSLVLAQERTESGVLCVCLSA